MPKIVFLCHLQKLKLMLSGNFNRSCWWKFQLHNILELYKWNGYFFQQYFLGKKFWSTIWWSFWSETCLKKIFTSWKSCIENQQINKKTINVCRNKLKRCCDKVYLWKMHFRSLKIFSIYITRTWKIINVQKGTTSIVSQCLSFVW